MEWIETSDLKRWAERRDCQETLPQLVRKLIRATAGSTSIQTIKFPSGDNILIGGWDGILEVTEETEYLPKGKSVWEFGANKDRKGKADDDYSKRSKNPIGCTPADTTYVFVTPRLWTKKDDWIAAKKADGIWKDIKVYDAEILEEWLEIAPTVAAWLAISHLNKFPSEGIQTTENFWDEWSTGPGIKLLPEIVVGGRANEVQRLLDKTLSPSVTAIKGSSRDECIAFIISSFKEKPERSEDFFSRSLIVDSLDIFRQLVVHEQPLILIPRFDDIKTLHHAASKGHTIIVPVDADASIERDDIALPKLDRDAFISALVKMGMNEETARKHSKEAARNITILRRQLKFDRSRPHWAKPEHARDIIPALMLNRWDVAYENDKAVVEQLANEKYEVYEAKLNTWVYSPDPPIVKIGEHWRLASSLDAWTYAAQYVTKQDFENLRGTILKTFAEINPALELDKDKRHMAAMYGKKRTFSSWIRQGQLQSLILISVFGDDLKLDLPVTGVAWVDRVVYELLNNADPLYWKSIEHELPLIAEASPIVFLNAVEKFIGTDNSPIIGLFEKEEGFLTERSYHTGLLWALEGIAWIPEYLSRVSLLFARLAVLDPGGKLSNRPENSLLEIYKSWHPQTLANLETRLKVLELIVSKEFSWGWNLLVKLLPEDHGTAMFTHSLRWRAFNEALRKPVTYAEIGQFCDGIVELLLKYFDNSEEQLSKLISASTRLPENNRNKVLSFIEGKLGTIAHTRHIAWNTLRDILSHHRSFPDANWALPAAVLDQYEAFFVRLKPQDTIDKYLWLFNNSWPSLPEGRDRKGISHDEQEKIIHSYRKEALEKIYSEHGIERITELSTAVSEAWAMGFVLGEIISEEGEIESICEFLSHEGKQLFFVQGFIFRKYVLNGLQWVFELYKKLKDQLAQKALANLFIPLPPTLELWKFIDEIGGEVPEEYWKKCRPHYYQNTEEERIYGLNRLAENKRFFTALDICSHSPEKIPTELIVRILELAATEKAVEPMQLSGYEFTRLFEALDSREDIDPQKFIQLEWMYVSVLADYGSGRKPRLLHDELAKNPDFFIEVLKAIYRPDNEERLKAEAGSLSPEQIENRAMQAYRLLDSWKKVPGTIEGGIDRTVLNDWVDKVRVGAEACDRSGKADIYIGKILAQFPETANNVWPPPEICEVIERINTETLKECFSTAIFNKRGSRSKAVFEGGVQERKLAEHFNELSKAHSTTFPNVSAILANLAKGYEVDAKNEDQRAEKDELEY